jgi:hypothetical protein
MFYFRKINQFCMDQLRIRDMESLPGTPNLEERFITLVSKIMNLSQFMKKISKFPGKMLVFRSDLSTDGSVFSLAAYFTFDWPQNPSFAVYDIGTKTELSQFSSSLRFINLEDRKVDPLPQWTKGDRVKAKLKDQTYSGEIDQIKKDVGWILIRFDSSKPKSSDWVRPWNLEKH